MSTPSANRPPEVDWHDSLVQNTHQDIAMLHEQLRQSLHREVLPEDLVISGDAVRQALGREAGANEFWAPPVEAEASLEYWAVHEGMVARVSQTSYPSIALGMQHTLANQALSRLSWVPLVEAFRTRYIADRVDYNPRLDLSAFARAASSHIPTDDDFEAMRRVARREWHGLADMVAYARVDPFDLEPIDKLVVMRRAATRAERTYRLDYGRIDPSTLESGVQISTEDLSRIIGPPLTDEEINAEAQQLVESELDNIITTAGQVALVHDIVLNGTRVRPSRPQHRV